MTWQDLPDGLVDQFRTEAFSLKGEGVIIVRVSGGSFRVSSYAGNFLAKLYDRLETLIREHIKADVVILTGRYDKHSREGLAPEVQVRLYGV